MKIRALLPALMLVVAAALVVAGWQWMDFRRVDGRTGRDWLRLVQQAARTTSYTADGYTIANGKRAHFTLEQGVEGRYRMSISGPDGDRCTLGCDGEQTWYATDVKTESAPGCCRTVPAMPPGRVTGTATVAGRPAVLLATQSGPATKYLAVDRKTGVILSMRTLFRRRSVSEMTIARIDYRAVVPRQRAAVPPPTLTPATSAQLATVLGHPVATPRWLPKGFALEGAYQDRCPCCGTEMAVLRYTDGLGVITLFEQIPCAQCLGPRGCHLAATKNALVETRRVGALTVTAVGNVDVRDLRKVLDRLR